MSDDGGPQELAAELAEFWRRVPQPEIGRGIRLLRQQFDSRRAFIDRMVDISGRVIGADESLVYRWERGETAPGPRYRLIVGSVCSAQLEIMSRKARREFLAKLALLSGGWLTLPFAADESQLFDSSAIRKASKMGDPRTSLVFRPHFTPDQRLLIRKLIVQIVDSHGLTPAQFASMIEVRLGRPGITADEVLAWQSGHRGPPPDDVLSVILKLAGDELDSILNDLLGLRPESMYANLQDEVERRKFLQWAASTALSASIAPDLEHVAWMLSASGRTNERPLDDLEGLIREMEQRCWRVAPGTLLPAVRTHLNLLTGLLGRSTPSPLRARLHTIAGSTAALAAWLSFLLKNYGEAHAYCLLGEAMAHEAGDKALRSHVLVIRSDLYAGIADGHRDGEAAKAIAILDQAEAAFAGSSHPFLRTWLLACRAESQATAGDEVATYRDLEAAECSLAAATFRAGGFFSPWDADRLAGFRGSCALTLHRAPEAVAILTDALKRTPESFTERPAVLADLAAAHAQQGELEAACALLSEAVASARALGHVGHIHRVLGTRQRLEKWATSPNVRQLDEELSLIQVV